MKMILLEAKKFIVPLLAILSVAIVRFLLPASNVFSFYIGYHTVIELLAVSLSFMICFTYVGILKRKTTTHTSILATSFLIVGCFDIFHTLSFKGMPDFFTANTVEKAIYFWLLARFFQSFAFLSLAIISNKNIKQSLFLFNLFVGISVVVFGGLVVFEHIDLLPRVYIDGTGLTHFKTYSEYFFMGICFISGAILYFKSKESEHKIQYTYLANAAFTMIATGLSFAIYTLHNDMLNFWGHILKTFSYVYLYRAILQVELLNPYEEIDLIRRKLDVGLENIKVLEEELQRSRKVASLGSEVRGIAHDLNNVLMIISNSANALLKINNNGDSIEAKKKVDHIKRAVTKSQDFLKSLINFSKNISNKKELIDLEFVFGEFSNLLRPLITRNINLTFYTERNLSVCLAPTDLEQIIFNLVLNARDAIDNDGTISVEAKNKCVDEPIDFLHYHIPRGEYVCISVVDTGNGIKEENISRIFDPFFTTKEKGKGTGIGLATVISIMQKNNGYVQVESKLGIGSVFTLYFLKPSSVEEGEFNSNLIA